MLSLLYIEVRGDKCEEKNDHNTSFSVDDVFKDSQGFYRLIKPDFGCG